MEVNIIYDSIEWVDVVYDGQVTLSDRVVLDALIQEPQAFQPVILAFSGVLIVQDLELFSVILIFYNICARVECCLDLVRAILRLKPEGRPPRVLLTSELLVLDCHCAQLVEYIDKDKLADHWSHQAELVNPKKYSCVHIGGWRKDVNHLFNVESDEAHKV